MLLTSLRYPCLMLGRVLIRINYSENENKAQSSLLGRSMWNCTVPHAAARRNRQAITPPRDGHMRKLYRELAAKAGACETV